MMIRGLTRFRLIEPKPEAKYQYFLSADQAGDTEGINKECTGFSTAEL